MSERGEVTNAADTAAGAHLALSGLLLDKFVSVSAHSSSSAPPAAESDAAAAGHPGLVRLLAGLLAALPAHGGHHVLSPGAGVAGARPQPAARQVAAVTGSNTSGLQVISQVVHGYGRHS